MFIDLKTMGLLAGVGETKARELIAEGTLPRPVHAGGHRLTAFYAVDVVNALRKKAGREPMNADEEIQFTAVFLGTYTSTQTACLNKRASAILSLLNASPEFAIQLSNQSKKATSNDRQFRASQSISRPNLDVFMHSMAAKS